MFSTEKYTENNNTAEKVLGTLKMENRITDDEYYAIKKSLEDAKYNICESVYPIDKRTDGEVLGCLVEDAVNSSCFDKDGFVEWLTTRAHRYLQSEIFKIVLTYIKTYADMDNRYFDGRNDWILEYANKIIEGCPEIFTYIDSVVKKENR